MTERMKNKISATVIISAIGLFITIGILLSNASIAAGEAKEKLNQLELQVNTCKGIVDKKVDKEEYQKSLDRVYQSLDRIEKKLDSHIQHTGK